MSDQEEDTRVKALDKLRGKAFALGGPLGNVFSKSFELLMRVFQNNLGNEKVINYALESLEQERALAISHDGNREGEIAELVYGMSDGMAVMIEGLMAERRSNAGLPPLPPRYASSNGSDTLPQVTVKQEDGGITMDDRPSTSRQAQMNNKRPSFADPISSNESPSSSRQMTSTAMPKSALRSFTMIQKTPATVQSRSANIPDRPIIRFNETNNASFSTGRVHQESSTSVKMHKRSLPDFVLRSHNEKKEGQSSSNSGLVKRSRTVVNYGEDDNDEYEQESLTESAPAAVTKPACFKCSDCDKSFPKVQGLTCHKRSHKARPTKNRALAKPRSNATHTAVVAPSMSEVSDLEMVVDADEEEEYDSDASVPPALDSKEEGTFVCDRCDGEFDNRAKLNKHHLIHTGTQCHICEKYMRAEDLASHQKRKHRESIRAVVITTPARSVVNDAAEPDFEDFEDFEDAPEDDEEYRPAGVPRDRNVSLATPRFSSVATPGSFPCIQCKKAFPTSKGLARHIASHGADNRPRHYCDQCSASRVSNWLLNYHKRKDHGTLPYVCSCGMSFALKTTLVGHRRETGHQKVPKMGQNEQPASPDATIDDRDGAANL